jgi:quinol monooxygenase YgiN
MLMIISILKINPLPTKWLEALDLLQYQRGPTLVEPGCIDCSVYECAADKAVLYIEKWQSRAELNRHIKSSSYMSVLTAMELSATAPEISFVESLEPDGMELIKALRSF